MIRNYLRIAFRNIFKQKLYNALNAVGLATGIAAGLIIALHIKEELSFDRQYPHYENIYRVHNFGWAKSSPRLAIEMSAMSQFDVIGRFAGDGTHVVKSEENVPGEVTGYYADSSVLEMFGFRLIEGDRKQALVGKKTAVITEKMAKQFFGGKSAIGKVIKFDNKKEYPVVAVMQDLPENSHLKFDYLISMPTFYEDVPANWTNNRGWMVMYTYVRFKSDKEYQSALTAWIPFMKRFWEGAPDLEKRIAEEPLQFMPLKDIHLRSKLEQEMGPNSNILYVYVFIAVEILILVVACANFMSLFTTQAIKRMREVGMRKIMGAKPKQLMGQFFTEVVLLTVISLIVAIMLYQLVLPIYNSIAGKSLGVWQIVEKENLLVIGTILLFVILFSGLYPAYFISRFKAGSFLKDDKLPNSMPNKVRSALVVFQFVVSASLIAATILVGQQMTLMKNKDLGFDKDQVVNVKLYGLLWQKTFSETPVVKNEFLKHRDIISVGRVGSMIGDNLSVEGVVPEGKEQEGDKYPSVRVLRVDEDYLKVMGVSFMAGRNFSTAFNDSSSFIINESAAKALRLEDPIGKRVNNLTMGRLGTVVGVVKDYHFATLHSRIEPLVLEYKPEWTGWLTVKVAAGKNKEALESIKKTIDGIAPGSLFVYEFLDDRLNMLYKSEDSMSKVFQFFSVLAIIIGCLGLLGLSAYTVERKTKEIGIRKVLGASVVGIVGIVSSRFFLLVLLGLAISIPLTWYGMNLWLQNFAYQITIEWWVFALTAGLIFMITVFVISFHTISAALQNPVHSLRYE